MSTLSDAIAKAQPRRSEAVRVCLRGDLIDQIEELRIVYALVAADDENENREPQAPEIETEIRRLEAEAADASVTFRFQSIGSYSWNELVGQHPPLDADLANGRDYNSATLPAAAIAACAIEPEDVTVDEVLELRKTASTGQMRQLFTVCQVINLSTGDIPKSGRLFGSPGSSRSTPGSAASEESLTASS